MEIEDTHHKEFITLRHLDSSAHDIILGQDWLAQHNPAFDWISGTTALTCLFRGCLATKLSSITDEVITVEDSENEEVITNINPSTTISPPVIFKNNIKINDVSSSYLFDPLKSNERQQLIKGKNISQQLSASTPLSTLDQPIVTQHDTPHTVPVTHTIPDKYKDFEIVFSKKEADRLPPHRPYDHTIPLKPSSEVSFGPLYNLSKIELDTLYEYIQENLAKGFIKRSEFPAGAPVFFVKKKDGSLRPVVDYRNLL